MIDLQKIEETHCWVTYIDKKGFPHEDEKYLIKYITDEQVRLQLAREKQVEKSSGKEQDGTEFVVSIASQAVIDWEGINSGGKKLPCTEPNKKTLFTKFLHRAKFVLDMCQKEELFLGDKMEEDLKN